MEHQNRRHHLQYMTDNALIIDGYRYTIPNKRTDIQPHERTYIITVVPFFFAEYYVRQTAPQHTCYTQNFVIRSFNYRLIWTDRQLL